MASACLHKQILDNTETKKQGTLIWFMAEQREISQSQLTIFVVIHTSENICCSPLCTK